MEKSELSIPLIFASMAAVYLLESWDYPWKSGFFPWVVIGFIFLLVTIFILKELVKGVSRKPATPRSATEPRLPLAKRLRSQRFAKALILCAGIFFYWVLASKLGFILTNLLIVAGLARLLGVNWRRTITISLVLTVVLHLFFREYLCVPFPQGPGEMLYFWAKRLLFP